MGENQVQQTEVLDHERLFSSRYILLTDQESVTILDHSKTLILALSPAWATNISSSIARFISRVYFRKLGAFFLLALAAGLAYVLYRVMLPNDYDSTSFIVLSTCGATYPLFFLLLMQPFLVGQIFAHFESMFLLTNIVLAIITFEILVDWEDHAYISIIVYISCFLSLILSDSWPLSFRNYNEQFLSILRDRRAASNNYRQSLEGDHTKIQTQRHHIRNLPGIQRFSEPPHERNSGYSARKTFLSVHLQHQTKELFELAQKCKKMYADLLIYTAASKDISFLKAKQRLSKITGSSSVVVMCFGILAPIYLSYTIKYSDIHVQDGQAIRIFRNRATIGSIFQAASFNVTLFCLRRLLMFFQFPLKIHARSHKVTAIPMVRAWVHFFDNALLHKLSAYVKYQYSNFQNKPQKKWKFDLNLKKRSSKMTNRIPVSSIRNAEDSAESEKAVVGCSDAEMSEHRNQSDHEAFCGIDFRFDGDFGSEDLLEKRYAIVFTPIECREIINSSVSLLQVLFKENLFRKLSSFLKKTIAFQTAILPLGVLLLFLDISLDLSDWSPVILVIYISESFFAIMHVMKSSLLILRRLKSSFENMYGLVLCIGLAAVMCDYSWDGHPYRLFGFFFMACISIKVTLVDAQPAAFSKIHQKLESVVRQIDSEQYIDPELLRVVLQHAQMVIRDGCTYMPIDEAAALINQLESISRHIPTPKNSLLGTIRKKWVILQFFGYETLLTLFFGIIGVLAEWILVDSLSVARPNDRVVEMIIFTWTSSGVIRSCCWSIAVFLAKRIFLHVLHPSRFVSYERRVVKMPLVPALQEVLIENDRRKFSRSIVSDIK